MGMERLPSGKWRMAVRHGGQRRNTKAFDTEAEAKVAGARLLIEMGGGGAERDHTITVEMMLHAHVAEMRPDDDHPADPDRWSPSYHADAERVVRRLIDNHPTFTGRRVRDVTPAILEGLWRELAAAGWTRWRMRRLHTVMSTAWQMAIRLDWTSDTPCPRAAPPTPREADVTPASPAQISAVLAELDGSDLEWLAVRILATAGVRRGDVAGIQWDAIDLDNAQVLIRQSLSHTPGKTHIMPTKAGRRSHRHLALDAQTVARLRRWRTRQVEQALTHGLPPPVWVFSSDGGVTPWRADRLTRVFIRAARRAGVKPLEGGGVRLNDMRHYVGTSMLEDGESLHDAAGQLGNTPATLEAKYRHWLPGRGRDGTDRRAARFDQG